jgi:dCMP deaminase
MTGFGNISKEIYDRAYEIIEGKWKDSRIEYHKRSWDEYNMSLAWEAASRSPDAQTKVGAYLTTEDHVPIATGYNGFPRKAMDNLLPNLRPDKYPWMIHAEINAILNAASQGKSTKDSILYCTHRPCFNCTMMIWQAGCREIIFCNSSKTSLSDNEETDTNLALFDIIIEGKLRCRGIDFGV